MAGQPIQASASYHNVHVKLPKLEIEPFSGDYTEWQGFEDNFVNTIDSNPTLSDVDKFKYLKRYLRGDALLLTQGYKLEGHFYRACFEMLKERYGKPQRAIFKHIDEFVALPKCDHDVTKLQHTYDECERHIRCLGSLGFSEDQFGIFFTVLILQKLPKYVRVEMCRKLGADDWSLQKLRDLLSNEIQARDLGENIPDSSSKTRPKQSGQSLSNRTGQATDSALVANGSKVRTCRFCQNEGHFSENCPTYRTFDQRKERIKGCCYACMRQGHPVAKCRTRKPCYHCQSSNHNRALCWKVCAPKQEAKKEHALIGGGTADYELPAESLADTKLISLGQTALLQTALAQVQGPNGSEVRMRLLLDTGCTRTCISERKSGALGLVPIREELISVAGFQDKKRRTAAYKVVEFNVQLRNGCALKVTANVVPQISCPVQRVPIDPNKYPILNELPLADVLCPKSELAEIDILIGADYYYDIVEMERLTCDKGFFLLRTKLGYIPTGRLEDMPSPTAQSCLHAPLMLENGLPVITHEPNLERLWSQEELGIREVKTCRDDEEAVRKFNETTTVDEDGRYEVRLPWKSEVPELPDNYGLALGCLKAQLAKFQSKPEVLNVYDGTVREQVKLGIVEQAPPIPDGDVVHYLPHHAVIKPDRATTKLRIVYNASAKSAKDRPSLNDCLYRGPVIMEDLVGMLIRFRVPKIAMTSDIEKAFLQVGIQTCDRDAARFLWVKDIHKPAEKSNLVVYRFGRVFFGCIASSFLLEGAIRKHLTSHASNPVAAEILDNHYVDNVHGGRNTAEEALVYYRMAKHLLGSAKMNLREWFSNNSETMASIPEWDRGVGSETKVLGLAWSVTKDTLSCAKTMKVGKDIRTKRQMLAELALVYDPLGFFCPIMLPIKVLLQSLWIQKHKWDEPLPADVVEKFSELRSSCVRISEITLNRWLGLSNDCEVTLHCFCDASQLAYSAVVFVAAEGKSTLVMAKSRVSPAKRELTIPRLELMGALIGTRLLNFVASQLRLPVVRKYLWSDSQCVLAWVTAPQVLTPFVENRIREIRQSQDVVHRYVPTKENPADLASRGCSFETLRNSDLWWHGPEWINCDKDQWPQWEVPRKPAKVPEESLTLVATTQKKSKAQTEHPLKISKFSDLPRLVRIVAWLKRFADNARSGVQSRRLGKVVTATEYRNALELLLKLDQRIHYSGLRDPQDPNSRLVKRQLGIFEDGRGIFRCKGRFKLSDIANDSKNPILLAKGSWLTTLIIRHCHGLCCHGGQNQTLALLRLTYWVPHGPSVVKRIILECRLCRRTVGGPFRYPTAPDLPDYRVTRSRPFDAVGVDHLGPLFVKTAAGEQKVWIVLFTCAATRAIHLEVVTDLTAAQVLMCIQRFAARFGTPTIIVSDNAKNYVACEKFIAIAFKQAIGSEAVQRFSCERGISWSFITERAPWMGGFYERLIGSVKKALRKALQKRKLTLVELQTVAAEIQACINSRPLVLSAECGENSLSPQNFLTGEKNPLMPVAPVDSDFRIISSNKETLRVAWNRIQAVANMFWKAWYQMYLPSLRPRKVEINQRGCSELSPSVGAVVQVKDESLKRECENFEKGGQICGSSDMIGNHDNPGMGKSNGKHDSDDSGMEQSKAGDPGMGRPQKDIGKRAAAKKAKSLIRHCVEADEYESD